MIGRRNNSYKNTEARKSSVALESASALCARHSGVQG